MNVFCRISLMSALLLFVVHVHALEYRVIDREHIEPYLKAMNEQRVKFYREYPYLFVSEGGADSEYVAVFLNSDETLMIGAFDHDKLIGCIIGVPLQDYNIMTCGAVEKDLIEAKNTFDNLPVDFNECYYISEMCVVQSGYDRDEIAEQLFKRFEKAFIDSTMNYAYLCMIVLESSETDPLRPSDPEQRWAEREGIHLANNGYVHTDYKVTYEWPTLQLDGVVQMQPHPMNFWYKKLNS